MLIDEEYWADEEFVPIAVLEEEFEKYFKIKFDFAHFKACGTSNMMSLLEKFPGHFDIQNPDFVEPCVRALPLGGWSGALRSFSVFILPQIGRLCLRDFSKESENYFG